MDYSIKLKYIQFLQTFIKKEESNNQKLPTAVPSRCKRNFISKVSQLCSEGNPASYSVSTRASSPGIKLMAIAFRKYFLPRTSYFTFCLFSTNTDENKPNHNFVG